MLTSLSTNLESIVGPAPKLHLTVLVIKRKPGYVNGTGRHEDTRGYVGAGALTGHHNIGGVGRIKCFTGTGK